MYHRPGGGGGTPANKHPNPPGAPAPLAGTRVGVYRAWLEDAAPGVVAACRAGLDDLEAAGATLVDVCLPELELVRCAQVVTIAAELAQAYKPALATAAGRRRFAPETRVSLAQAGRLSATDYIQALKIRARLLTHIRRLLTQCDILAAPTCGTVAPIIRWGAAERGGGTGVARRVGGCVWVEAGSPKATTASHAPPHFIHHITPLSTSRDALRYGETDLRQTGELMRFTIPVNMSGLPAVSVPVGTGEAGMPVGLQLIGGPWDEAGLLYVAAVLEAAAAPRLRPPALRFDLLAPAALARGG